MTKTTSILYFNNFLHCGPHNVTTSLSPHFIVNYESIFKFVFVKRLGESWGTDVEYKISMNHSKL